MRTALQCVHLVYLGQAVCPPAPATTKHLALQLTAPASAEKVENNKLLIDDVNRPYFDVKDASLTLKLHLRFTSQINKHSHTQSLLCAKSESQCN